MKLIPQEACDASAFMDLILHACSSDGDKRETDQDSTDVDATVGTEAHGVECLLSEGGSVALHILPDDDESCNVEDSLNGRQCGRDGDRNGMQEQSSDLSDSELCRPEPVWGSHESLDRSSVLSVPCQSENGDRTAREGVLRVSSEDPSGVTSNPDPNTSEHPARKGALQLSVEDLNGVSSIPHPSTSEHPARKGALLVRVDDVSGETSSLDPSTSEHPARKGDLLVRVDDASDETSSLDPSTSEHRAKQGALLVSVEDLSGASLNPDPSTSEHPARKGVLLVSVEDLSGVSPNPDPSTSEHPAECIIPDSSSPMRRSNDGGGDGMGRSLDFAALTSEPCFSEMCAVANVGMDQPPLHPSKILSRSSVAVTLPVSNRLDACAVAAARLTPLSSVTIFAGRVHDLSLEEIDRGDGAVSPGLHGTDGWLASMQLTSTNCEIKEEESLRFVSPPENMTDDASDMSQVPIVSRKLTFWNENGNDVERMQLLDSVALLSSRIPTIVLQHILDEVISDPSFPCFGSSDDDDDIMSMESTMSELSDIDERVYGTPTKPHPTPTSHGRSLGGGLMTFAPRTPEHDANEAPCGWGETRHYCAEVESRPITPHSVCRSLGGGQIPMIQHSPGGDSDDDENSRLAALDIWQYGAACAKSAWCPDSKMPPTFPTVESALCVARSLFSGNVAEEVVSPNETLVSVTTLRREYEIERKLALKALGVNLERPKELLEMAYSMGSQRLKDPFPYDSEDERQTEGYRFLQQSSSSHDEMENEGSISRFYESSIDGDDVSVVYDSELAFASRRQSAILSIEITGLTASYSKTFSSFIESIFDEVTAHGGDILTFSGETVIVEWTTLNPEPVRALGERSFVPSTLGECALAAAMCAAKIMGYDSHVQRSVAPAFHLQEPQGATECVKWCALGVGEVLGIHVSGRQSNRKHVVIGEALDQVFKASWCAQHGQVMSSGKALRALGTACDLRDQYSISDFSDIDRPCVIATQNSICWGGITTATTTSTAGTRDLVFKAARKLPTVTLQHFRRLVSAYTDPTLATIDEDAFIPKRDASSCGQLTMQRHGVESWPAFALCISPSVPIHLSGNDNDDKGLVELLNDVMGFITHELLKFRGQLHQFVVDGTGVVFVATFGIHDSSPEMVADLALPAAISIHNGLLQQLNVHNRVALSFGEVYGGVASGTDRDVAVIMGAPVDLAKQLMVCDVNPGVLVDHAVRMLANMAYAFNALAPIETKGDAEVAPIFEPLSPFCRSWGRVLPNFVGRAAEIAILSESAKAISLDPKSDPRMIFLCGDGGMGKSATMNYTLEHIRRVMLTSRRRFLLASHLCEEINVHLPFSAFTNLLLSVLKFHHSWPEERGLDSQKTPSCLVPMNLETLPRSHVGPDALRSRYKNTIRAICSEMSAPFGFADFIGQFLPWSDSQSSPPSREEHPSIRGTSMNAIVSFMARAFCGCIDGSQLTIVALDDVHNMDELSWQVLEALFDTSENMLFVCTVKGLSPSGSGMSNSFWRKLNADHRESGRFKVLVINELLDENIRQLSAKTLGHRLEAIPTQSMRSLVTQAKGCPSIASAILESMKRRSISSEGARFCLDSEAKDYSLFTDVDELLACRIESLPSAVRKVLDIGAILGNSFELFELLDVLKFHDESDEAGGLSHDHIGALEAAIEEGILHVSQVILNDDEYDFYHSGAALKLWRKPQDLLELDNLRQTHIRCAFADNSWYSTTVGLMHASRKVELHRAVAIWLQTKAQGQFSSLSSRTFMLSHWKAAKCWVPAAAVALSIACSYEQLDMCSQGISILTSTLELWTLDANKNADDTLPPQSFRGFSKAELELSIHLLSELGRLLAKTGRASESLSIYRQGLAITSHAQSVEDFDRSTAFQLYIGLLSAIRIGLIEQDEELSLEQELIARFVKEAFLHRDPVHYSLALAMEAEVMCRLGLFQEAALVHTRLVQVYDPDEHSISITNIYGSDCVAQCFGQSATWYSLINEPEAALEVCSYVKMHLLPKMARNGAPNIMLILYPVLWVLKDYGRVSEAKQMFQRYVVDAIQECTNAGPFHRLLEPIRMLLDLAAGQTTDLNRRFMVEWALNEDNLRFDLSMNCTLGHSARCPDSISAEICLFLARIHLNPGEVSILVRTGMTLADKTLAFAKERGMRFAFCQILPVHRSLRALLSASSV